MALTKAERERYRAIRQPNPREVEVLRRVAGGSLVRTNGTADKGKPSVEFNYEDGSPMTSLARPGSRRDDEKIVNGMVTSGWLIPIEGETLIEGTAPQRYRARTVSDGLLPRFVKR